MAKFKFKGIVKTEPVFKRTPFVDEHGNKKVRVEEMEPKVIGEQDSISMYDHDFTKGKAVEVDESAVAYRYKDEEGKRHTVLVVDKFRSNQHFDEVNGDTSGRS